MKNQNENQAYTGSEEDPEDGPAVAASIFTAVFVYAVRFFQNPSFSVLTA